MGKRGYAPSVAECGHPDRPVHGHGKCKRCYQKQWHREYRPREREPSQRKQKVTIYPQAIVRGLPRGWGSIG